MGTLLNATCRSCGYTSSGLLFGYSMMNPTARVPAIRKDTGAFVVEDLSDDPNLQFYHQREMYQEKIEGYGIQCAEISLNPTSNLCPSCGDYTMDFEVFGEFD